MAVEYKFNRELQDEEEKKYFKYTIYSAVESRQKAGLSPGPGERSMALYGPPPNLAFFYYVETILRRNFESGILILEQPGISEYLRDRLSIENPYISERIICLSRYNRRSLFDDAIFNATSEWLSFHPSVAHHLRMRAYIEDFGIRSGYSQRVDIYNIHSHIVDNSIYSNRHILQLFSRELMLHNPHVIEYLILEYARLISMNAVFTVIQDIIFRETNWFRRKNFMSFLVGSGFQPLLAKQLQLKEAYNLIRKSEYISVKFARNRELAKDSIVSAKTPEERQFQLLKKVFSNKDIMRQVAFYL